MIIIIPQQFSTIKNYPQTYSNVHIPSFSNPFWRLFSLLRCYHLIYGKSCLEYLPIGTLMVTSDQNKQNWRNWKVVLVSHSLTWFKLGIRIQFSILHLFTLAPLGLWPMLKYIFFSLLVIIRNLPQFQIPAFKFSGSGIWGKSNASSWPLK